MLVKDKVDTPQSIIESLRLNFEKDEIREILPIKRLANSQPTPPEYPQTELDRAVSVSVSEAVGKENILTSLYRSFIDDQERVKEVEQIKLRKQREILERYEAKKETYRQQLISIEQARKQYLELEAGLSNRIEEKITNYLTTLRSTTDQITPKIDRILRAYLLGLINAERVVLDRPDEDEYTRLRNHIKSQDGHSCIICHKTSAASELHVHHIIPLSLFGTNEPQNLVTLCYSCHNKQHPEIDVTRNKPIRRPRKNAFIAISIKTTGFYNEDEIIEIGAALFEKGKVVEKFQSLLHTKRPLYDRFSKLTGITQEMLDGAPKPDTVFPQFLSFIGTSKLVVHNESFVMRFLQKNAQYCGTTISNNITDSLSLARKKLPQLDSKKLYVLTNHFNINKPFSSNALDDSIATGFVYLSLAKLKKSQKKQ